MQIEKFLKLLNFVFFDTMSHHIIKKYYIWCYIKTVFTKNIHTFEEVPTADPVL